MAALELPVRQLELKIPPLALCAAFAVAIAAVGYVWPSATIPFNFHRGVSVVLVLLGLVVALAGVVQFGRAKTTVNPMVPNRATAIVASGVFSRTRNPMYVGMAVGLVGVSTWHVSLPGYALVLLFCLYMTEFQIKPEERALAANFGDSYATYMATVRRWI